MFLLSHGVICNRQILQIVSQKEEKWRGTRISAIPEKNTKEKEQLAKLFISNFYETNPPGTLKKQVFELNTYFQVGLRGCHVQCKRHRSVMLNAKSDSTVSCSLLSFFWFLIISLIRSTSWFCPWKRSLAIWFSRFSSFKRTMFAVNLIFNK